MHESKSKTLHRIYFLNSTKIAHIDLKVQPAGEGRGVVREEGGRGRKGGRGSCGLPWNGSLRLDEGTTTLHSMRKGQQQKAHAQPRASTILDEDHVQGGLHGENFPTTVEQRVCIQLEGRWRLNHVSPE